MFKKVISVLLSLCIISPGATAFAAETQESVKKDSSTIYWEERFPTIKEQLDNGELKELVGNDEMYIKYTPKNDNINMRLATESDFTSEAFTKEEYIKERQKESITTRDIGPFEPNESCSWLRLDLQVYSTAIYGEYQACSFWEWQTNPIFRINDLNGIYVSSEMLIARSHANNPIISEFRYRETNSGVWCTTKLGTSVSEFGNGVAATVKLPGDSELFAHDSFRGMLCAPVEFSNTGSIRGRIYTSYGHSYIAIGDEPSFDSEGKPSFGLTNAREEHSGSVHVSR
ncbi:hypothetical protein [Clostridium senegalense]|uniref:hypothetical protein n=1 Tax=Clostridium senegalense TaxID=1465809 RepID=UPI0002881E33|nr:hypothetical protein [Clostridium senegalense]